MSFLFDFRSLRERREDIPSLVWHFARQLGECLAITKRSSPSQLDFCFNSGLLFPYKPVSADLPLTWTRVQARCRVTDPSNSLMPFQAICTPMQTRRNDDNFVITIVALRPSVRARRSANP